MHVCAGTALCPAHVQHLYVTTWLLLYISRADPAMGLSWSALVCAAKGEVGLVCANEPMHARIAGLQSNKQSANGHVTALPIDCGFSTSFPNFL